MKQMKNFSSFGHVVFELHHSNYYEAHHKTIGFKRQLIRLKKKNHRFKTKKFRFLKITSLSTE